MDQITIEDLEVSFRVGVPDEERSQPQKLLVTMVMAHDFSVAARTDDLSATIDYYAVSQRIMGLGEGREWRLIEKLAVDIAQTVLDEFGARSARITVKKFIIPETRWVAVEVQRDRNA
jgi:7,8-dihydroneopterin aldolase/epimerase/oxygenase